MSRVDDSRAHRARDLLAIFDQDERRGAPDAKGVHKLAILGLFRVEIDDLYDALVIRLELVEVLFDSLAGAAAWGPKVEKLHMGKIPNER